MDKARYSSRGAALYEVLHAAEQLRRAETGVGRVALLDALERMGLATVSQLARERGQSRQAAQRVAHALVAEGLAQWQANPRHRRASLLQLTAAGRSSQQAGARRRCERLNAASRLLDPAALREAARQLGAATRALGVRP